MGKASDYRNRQAKRPAPTADITLPSGAVFKMRRLPLDVWVQSGHVPHAFLLAQLKAENNEPDAQQAMASLTAEDTLKLMEFTRDAILYSVVEPKLVVGGKGDDVLDPCEIAPDDFQFLMQWLMEGCPGVPVLTRGDGHNGEGGATSVESLRDFRKPESGSGSVATGADGAEIQHKAESPLRVAG